MSPLLLEHASSWHPIFRFEGSSQPGQKTVSHSCPPPRLSPPTTRCACLLLDMTTFIKRQLLSPARERGNQIFLTASDASSGALPLKSLLPVPEKSRARRMVEYPPAAAWRRQTDRHEQNTRGHKSRKVSIQQKAGGKPRNKLVHHTVRFDPAPSPGSKKATARPSKPKG